jgi:hypothetical protein
MPSLWSSLILYVEIGVLAAFHKIGASMRRDPASGIFCFWILVWLLEKLNQKGNQEQFRAHVRGMCEWSLRNSHLFYVSRIWERVPSSCQLPRPATSL